MSSLNDGLDSLYGGGTIRQTLGLGCNVVMIFAVIPLNNSMGLLNPNLLAVFKNIRKKIAKKRMIVEIIASHPVAAIAIFFVAVILVIIGTYLLFTAGSVLQDSKAILLL